MNTICGTGKAVLAIALCLWCTGFSPPPSSIAKADCQWVTPALVLLSGLDADRPLQVMPEGQRSRSIAKPIGASGVLIGGMDARDADARVVVEGEGTRGEGVVVPCAAPAFIISVVVDDEVIADFLGVQIVQTTPDATDILFTNGAVLTERPTDQLIGATISDFLLRTPADGTTESVGLNDEATSTEEVVSQFDLMKKAQQVLQEQNFKQQVEMMQIQTQQQQQNQLIQMLSTIQKNDHQTKKAVIGNMRV